MTASNLKLVVYTIGIYSVFLLWGFVQEKLTSSPYTISTFPAQVVQSQMEPDRVGSDNNSSPQSEIWSYPIALNTLMALSAFILASIGDLFFPNRTSLIISSTETTTTTTSTSTTATSVTTSKSITAESSNPANLTTPIDNTSKSMSSTSEVKNSSVADSHTQSYLFKEMMISLWKPTLTCALASPLGYSSLSYISYPLMVLAKSSKPVPLMFVGYIYYQKRYSWDKIASVMLICAGISAYSLLKTSKTSSSSDISNSSSSSSSDSFNLVIGISMILMNLFLDAYTNNEQDSIYKKYRISSFQMMKYVNIWQVGYLLLYLIAGSLYSHCISGNITNSELFKSIRLISLSSELRLDIVIFCACAALGQIMIFEVMKDFGSLMWITISVTRKLFTILLSIYKFNHPVNIYQWMGILAVFAGMGLEVLVKYREEKKVKSD